MDQAFNYEYEQLKVQVEGETLDESDVYLYKKVITGMTPDKRKKSSSTKKQILNSKSKISIKSSVKKNCNNNKDFQKNRQSNRSLQKKQSIRKKKTKERIFDILKPIKQVDNDKPKYQFTDGCYISSTDQQFNPQKNLEKNTRLKNLKESQQLRKKNKKIKQDDVINDDDMINRQKTFKRKQQIQNNQQKKEEFNELITQVLQVYQQKFQEPIVINMQHEDLENSNQENFNTQNFSISKNQSLEKFDQICQNLQELKNDLACNYNEQFLQQLIFQQNLFTKH